MNRKQGRQLTFQDDLMEFPKFSGYSYLVTSINNRQLEFFQAIQRS